MKHLRLLLQIFLPIAVLVGGLLLAKAIGDQAKAPTVTPPMHRPPFVRTHVATAADLRLDVETQGTVEPFRTVELTAQVGGRILTTSPSLRTGGICAAGDVLLLLDPIDCTLLITQEEAAVARAELRLLQERAEADAAVRAWQQLEGERAAEPLVTRQPQIRDAEQALAAARARLDKSRLDLERTKITAPVAGRVRSVSADVGQTVQPGQRLAVLLDTSCVEVRLPVPVSDLAFLDLPLGGDQETGSFAEVTLTADFAGRNERWTGRVVRTEGEIDRRTRQLTVVVRVERNETNGEGGARPPLLVGMFVEAVIQGRTFPQVVSLPRAALQKGDHVWVADAEHRLRLRSVQLLRSEAERVLLRAGVSPGEQVAISRLDTPVDGMPVRVETQGSDNKAAAK